MATMVHRKRTADQARQERLVQLLSQQGAVLRSRIRSLRDGQPSGVMDAEERSLDAEEQDVGSSLLELTSQMVQGIEAALRRLEAGELGTCADCRGTISEARLRALPFASQCLVCRERQDRAKGAPASRSLAI